PQIVDWKPNGLFFAASARTYAYLYKLDPDTRTITKMPAPDQTVNSSFSIAKDGQTIASLRSGPTSMAEVFVGSKKLTDLNAQTSNWTTSTLEVVSWKSQDGAT